MEKWIGTRISYLDSREECTMIVYPKRNNWKEAVLFAWVLGYSFVGAYMMYLLFFGMDTIDNSLLEGDVADIKKNQQIYLSVFIAFWAYFEYKVVKGFLWLIKGKELLKITKDELTVKRDVFGYGKANKYFLDNVKNFEIVEHKTFSFGFDYENAFWRQGTNSLIFDANGKSIGFAKKIEPKDANLLMRLMKDRMKKLRKR